MFKGNLVYYPRSISDIGLLSGRFFRVMLLTKMGQTFGT